MNRQRQEIESEIKCFMDVLQSQGVGMKDPLVDSEGFPRGDVDVYQIRFARNKIVTLENDCRQLMKSIERKLHEFHSIQSSNEVGR